MPEAVDTVGDVAVRSVLSGILPPNCNAARIRLHGADALVFHRLDHAEHNRRTDALAGWLDDSRPLETLMNLPAGFPVQRASLEPALRPEIRRLPKGAAVVDSLSVTRLAVRPLRVDLIVVRARGWKSGLNGASQFAPFSRRAMLLERVPKDVDEKLFEASFYGIGVLVADGEAGVRMLLEPSEWRAIRHTTAAWRFAEEVYRKVVDQVGNDDG
jgi:hypothetical protein